MAAANQPTKQTPEAKKRGKAKKKSDNGSSTIPRSEREGVVYEIHLKNYINRHGGRFLRDDDGSLHVILNGKRIALTHDRNNEGLARLMLKACLVSTLTAGAQAAIQRLRVFADEKANKGRLKKFSAFLPDSGRLYIPLSNGNLLLITAAKIEEVTNGTNQDELWLEHPYDKPMNYSKCNVKEGLQDFERLAVESQSCAVPEMKWFVAMFEGLFPFIRDGFQARLMPIHLGGPQQGKTSGAARFTLLHGLTILGDYTVASLGNVGDIGLMVLDNKETNNFTQSLIDFCLFLATGADRGRSFQDGRLRVNRDRPVAIITSIEGVPKQELQARCVEVKYEVAGQKIGRDAIEQEISRSRHKMASALVAVLQRYLTIRQTDRPIPNPIPEFAENFRALADLLRAYEEVAGKPQGWADQIVGGWESVISAREDEEDDLEQPLRRVLDEFSAVVRSGAVRAVT